MENSLLDDLLDARIRNWGLGLQRIDGAAGSHGVEECSGRHFDGFVGEEALRGELWIVGMAENGGRNQVRCLRGQQASYRSREAAV